MAVPPVFVSGQVLTAAQMNAIGLWEIQTASFTTSSAETYTCFTSDYDNYRVLLTITATSAANASISYQLGNSGTFSTTTYAAMSFFISQVPSSGNFTADNFTGTSAFMTQAGGDKMPSICDMTLFGPFLTRETRHTHVSFSSYANPTQNRVAIFGAGGHGTATSYSQLRIIPGSGTMTGSISIYGMRP